MKTIDTTRINISLRDWGWSVWIPPIGPESYENGDVEAGAYIDEFGENGGFTFEEAVDFVRYVQRKHLDAFVAQENAAGRHLPEGYVDDGYICDACIDPDRFENEGHTP